MDEASSRERDEFGPVVSIGQFLGLLALVLFGGSGSLELYGVALDRNWAGSSHTVVQVRAGVEGGLAVGAAVACVAFGRVRRDLFHRAAAWFALIVVGPLATLLGQIFVASCFGAFVAPAAEGAVASWARMAVEWALAGGVVTLGLVFLRREPTRRSRLLYACGALAAVVVLAITGREFGVDSFTSPMRYACVLPLVLRTCARSIPKAVVLATVVLAGSGVFLGNSVPRFGAQWEVVLAMGLWLGVALPLVLARRYDALGVDADADDSKSRRRWVGAVVLLLLVSPLVAIATDADGPRPCVPEMPSTIWLRTSIETGPSGLPHHPSHVYSSPRIDSPDGRLLEWHLRELGDGWNAGVYDARVSAADDHELRLRVVRNVVASGVARLLLPPTPATRVLGEYHGTEEVVDVEGKRYLRFDLRASDDDR